MPVFRELVDEHKLDMKPIDVEYLFDGDKIVFYFVAEERVDFRDLVRDLAAAFQARIDMRQVGVRDEARMVGGLGPLRRAAVLRALRRRVPAGLDPHGERTGPAAEPLENLGTLRQTHVLSALRVRRLQGLQVPCPQEGRDHRDPARPGKGRRAQHAARDRRHAFEDGKRVTVPLAEMGCSKGTGCPCTVSRETLEEAGGTATSLAFAALDREAEAAAAPPAPAPKPRSGRGDGGRQRSAAPEKREASGKSAAPAEKTEGADKAPEASKGDGGRKRRRRGGRGGGEGAATGGQAAKPAEGAKAPKADKPAAQAGEAGAPKGNRKRRRRRPGSGGGSGSGDAPQA